MTTDISLWFSVGPTVFIFIALPFYHVTCVHILGESSYLFLRGFDK